MNSRRLMQTWIIGGALLALMAMVPLSYADEVATEVPSALWAEPRSAGVVAAEPAIADVVAAWSAQPRRVIVVRHGPGETGELRAGELRGWLVALGVPSDAIDVRMSEDVGDRLRLQVR